MTPRRCPCCIAWLMSANMVPDRICTLGGIPDGCVCARQATLAFHVDVGRVVKVASVRWPDSHFQHSFVFREICRPRNIRKAESSALMISRESVASNSSIVTYIIADVWKVIPVGYLSGGEDLSACRDVGVSQCGRRISKFVIAAGAKDGKRLG